MKTHDLWLCLDADCEEINFQSRVCTSCGNTALYPMGKLLNRNALPANRLLALGHTCVERPNLPCENCAVMP